VWQPGQPGPEVERGDGNRTRVTSLEGASGCLVGKRQEGAPVGASLRPVPSPVTISGRCGPTLARMFDRDKGARTRGRGPSARVGARAPTPWAWAVAAWVTCGLVWSLGLATIGLAVAGRVPPARFVTTFMALGPLFAMPAALLGARIVQQRRGNRLGWILLAMGLTQAIAQTANAYAWLSINRHGGGLVGTALATWVCSFAWIPNFALGPYLLLLFPNGRLPGRRWRPAAWAGGAVMATLIAAFAVLAWPVRGTTLYQNTLGEVALAPLDALEGLLYLVGDTLIVVAAVALLMRLRRLRGAERQQTKWFAFGAIPWVAVDLTWVAVQLTGGDVSALAAGLGSLIALSGLLGTIAVASSGTSSTTSTGCSTGPWCTRWLPRSWGLATPPWCSCSARCWAGIGPAWGSRWRHWRRLDCSNHCAAASSRRWTGASTGAATTRPRPSSGSVATSARRSTWTCSPASCCGWSTRRWSRPRCGCGCDRGLVLPTSVGCALADHRPVTPTPSSTPGSGPGFRWCCRPRTAACGGRPQGRP
jgi:hypothetical protein